MPQNVRILKLNTGRPTLETERERSDVRIYIYQGLYCPVLKVLSYSQFTAVDSVGLKKTIRSRSFKGYLKEEEHKARTAKKDEIIYDVFPIKPPADMGDLASGTSILYPGKIGEEYYFTKGHFHNILMTAEVYFGMAGEGLMLLENKEGDWDTLPITPGATVYVPKGYAHRTVNTGSVPLVTYFCFRSDAGQDYGSIEEKGYRKLIVERDGKPVFIDNPKWGK